MTFRRRTFPEVLNNLLTSITNGVAGESHPYPPPRSGGPPHSHYLRQSPVAEIVAVYGTRLGEPHQFRKGTDYDLSSDGLALEWKGDAQVPDDGTLVQVNYRPAASPASLTDIHTGSVIRTLAESVALEIAGLYAQLDSVYQSGFIDLATGRSLDNVVALLGIQRVTGGKAAGEVQFTRSPASRGAINIPQGTRVMTADGSVEYETTAAATIGPGQNVARVPVRDIETNAGLDADTLTVLPVPIAGIVGVANPAPTVIDTQDETDAELRTRAKAFLYGSERATLGALNNAVRKQGITADIIELDAPGYIEVTPQVPEGNFSPEARQRLAAAVRDARPAGIKVNVLGAQAPRRVNLEMRVTTVNGLLEQDLRAAQQAVREHVADYFQRLPAKEAGSVNRLAGLALSVPEVEDVRILSASWQVGDSVEDILDRDSGQLLIQDFHTVLGDLHIADPNLPTRLDVVVAYPRIQTPPDVETPPPDSEAIGNALTQFISEINARNASELPESPTPEQLAERRLTYAGLYDRTPLPDKSAGSPYSPRFTFTQASSLSQTLETASDGPYQLTPFERLSLGSVELSPDG